MKIVGKHNQIYPVIWDCKNLVEMTGTHPEIPGTELDGWQDDVFRVSHMSFLPSGTKNSQINQIFGIHFKKINLIPLFNSSFPNSSFGITKPILIPHWKIIVSRFALQTQKCIAMHLSPFSPLVPLWSQQKFTLFIFCFLTRSELLNLNWGEPHNLCSLLHLCKKWLTMSARLICQ